MDTKLMAAAMAAKVAIAVIEPENLSRMMFSSALHDALLWIVAFFVFSQ
jgi:hypothetical protein